MYFILDTPFTLRNIYSVDRHWRLGKSTPFWGNLYLFSFCDIKRYRFLKTLLMVHIVLVFPRDGKSRCPFVPGQKIPCPAVPLSRDKKSFLVRLSLCPGTKKVSLSHCPGTRATAKIPGQALLSRDVPRDKMALYFALFCCSHTT